MADDDLKITISKLILANVWTTTDERVAGTFDAADAIIALLAGASMWQPIDTAPLDGTPVDIWIEAEGANFRAVEFRWNGITWEHRHYGSLENAYANVDMRATYWMPVPKPPTSL